MRLLLLGCLALAGGVLFLAQPQRRARVHRERGRLFLRQGRYQAAIAEFERSRALAPPGWAEQLLVAGALARQGRTDAAIATWTALADTPFAADAFEAAALHARDVGWPDRALQLCRTAEERGLPSAPFEGITALVLLDAGRIEDALARYREVAEPIPPAVAGPLITALADVGADAEAEALAFDAVAWYPDDTDMRLWLAAVLHGQGRFADALPHYRAVLRERPESLEARLDFLQALQGAGELDEAESEARRALTDPDAAPVAGLVLGQVAVARGDLTEAVKRFELATGELPQGPLPFRWLAETRLRRGEFAEGLAALRTAVARAPDDPALRLDLLRLLWTYDLQDEARALAADFPGTPDTQAGRTLLAAVRASARAPEPPGSLEVLVRTVGRALEDGDFETALQAASRAHRQWPEEPAALLLLARVAEARDDVRGTLGYLEEARRLEPGHAATARARARLCRRLGQVQLAAATLYEAAGAGGTDAAALAAEAAALYLEAGRADRAVATLRAYGDQVPRGRTGALLAEALLRQGRVSEATVLAAKLSTREGQILQYRALLAARADAAAAVLGQSLAAEPRADDLPLPAHWLSATGDTLLRRAETAAANSPPHAAAVRRLRDLRGDGDERFAPARAYALAVLADRADWPAVAMRFYEDATIGAQAVLLEPAVRCAHRLGRLDDAVALARRATADPAAGASVWYLRAALEGQAGDGAPPAETVRMARERFPDDPQLLALGADVAERAGDRIRAIALYRRAWELQPQATVANNLAWLLLQTSGAEEEAVALARAAHERAPASPAVLDTFAWCLYKTDRMEEALYYGNLAVLLDPGEAEYRYHRVQMLAASGRVDPAREDFRALLGQVDPAFAARPGMRRLAMRLGLQDLSG